MTSLLTEIAGIADQLGDHDAAGRARSEAGAVASHAARVVVVGEKKRGKSSLINALLRRPGLLPVDADIATSVHITVHAADADEAIVIDEDAPGGRDITLSEVGEYAALDNSTMEMRHPGVREVSVGLPDPLLKAGIELVDTPGVGGLVSGHAELTLVALSLADALLFVVNGSSELTASELAFLTRATERVRTVLFVITQTDKYPKWRNVLAQDQALIVAHAPQFAKAPWFPVSSRMRLDAERAAASDSERAAILDDRSGFMPLERTLAEQIAGRAGELRAVNAAWVARRVLENMIAAQDRRLRSLSKDPTLVAAVAEQRAKLGECRRADAAWRQDVDRGFRELSRQMQREYTRRITDLQANAERWATEADTSTATQIAHDFDAGLQAMWVELEAAARAGGLRIAAQALARIGSAGISELSTDIPYPEQLDQLPRLQLTEETVEAGFSGFLSRYWPSLSGLSMTSLAGHLIFATVNPLAIIGVGGVVAAALFKSGKDRADKARAREDVYRHIKRSLAKISVEMPAALQDGMEALHTEIQERISGLIRERDAELQTALADASRHLDESEEQLAPQRASAEQALQRLRALAERVARVTSQASRQAASELTRAREYLR